MSDSEPWSQKKLDKINKEDEEILVGHKDLFTYLNKTKSDDQIISQDYDDLPIAENPKLKKRMQKVNSHDPLPVTRRPDKSLRFFWGKPNQPYNAEDISYKTPVSIHPINYINLH